MEDSQVGVSSPKDITPGQNSGLSAASEGELAGGIAN